MEAERREVLVANGWVKLYASEAIRQRLDM
jgi:hypothetical protein